MPTFSNQETEDVVRWLVVNLTGTGLQELLRQEPPPPPNLDTPVENLGYQLRKIFTQFLPPEFSKEILRRVNWVEVAACLMELDSF